MDDTLEIEPLVAGAPPPSQDVLSSLERRRRRQRRGKAVQIDIRLNLGLKALSCQPVESTSLFKVLVSDGNMHPYAVASDDDVNGWKAWERELR